MSITLAACPALGLSAARCQQQQPRTAVMQLALRPCGFRRAALGAAVPAGGQRRMTLAARAEGGSGGQPQRPTEFGYNRKDVLLIGGGLIGAGFGLYYGLQATGMEPGMAGNWAQLIIFLGLTFGWVGSYLYRVATKQMTYVKQLEDYEEAVMRKRLEEMPEAEMERVMAEVEAEKAARRARQTGSGGGGSGSSS